MALSVKTIAVNLKRLRAQKGLSQQQLAVAAGLSVAHVARLETGSHDPRLGTLVKLCDALGVPLQQLFR